MNVNAVTHGFRSSFRDWVSEATNYQSDLAEQALAHTLQNKVEAAYRRGDALEKRREMMNDWAYFCENNKSPKIIIMVKKSSPKGHPTTKE
jgi:integrase